MEKVNTYKFHSLNLCVVVYAAIVFSLCHNRWGKVSAYETGFTLQHSYKKLYMLLDNGTLTFTADPHEVSTGLCAFWGRSSYFAS